MGGRRSRGPGGPYLGQGVQGLCGEAAGFPRGGRHALPHEGRQQAKGCQKAPCATGAKYNKESDVVEEPAPKKKRKVEAEAEEEEEAAPKKKKKKQAAEAE